METDPSRPRGGKFALYEVVRVRELPRTISDGTASLEGVILGVSMGDSSTDVSYSVFLDELQEAWFLDEKELESTGRFTRREDHYSGESIRVTRKGRPSSQPPGDVP